MVNRRVDYIIEKMNFYGHDGEKTKALGFCATVKHAKYMAKNLTKDFQKIMDKLRLLFQEMTALKSAKNMRVFWKMTILRFNTFFQSIFLTKELIFHQ